MNSTNKLEMETFSLDKITRIFRKEFGVIEHKIKIIRVLNGKPFTKENILNSKEESNLIWHPGVYVFFGNKRIWKVGRHLTNSRKRATQHITENTQTQKHRIKDLEKILDAELILFNVKEKEDNHWVAAIEIFLEKQLKPLIQSKRTG